MPELNKEQRALVNWLGRDEYSQYGECYGSDLDSLVEMGLAQIHDNGQFQEGFIAKHPTHPMFRAVSLTEAGRSVLAALHAEGDTQDW